MEIFDDNVTTDNVEYVTKENVELIVTNYGYTLSNEQHIESYAVHNSKKMLGFLADYWRLKVIIGNKKEKKLLSFFLKAKPRNNASKANMLQDMDLFNKEIMFYTTIKSCMELPGLKPWSGQFVTSLDDAIVFQDLDALQYQLRNKFERFDMAHTLQALRTLTRFHASSIIYEDNRSKELHRRFKINEIYEQFLGNVGYKMTDPWFIQCMEGALEAVRTFSKYGKNKQMMSIIDSRWRNIWSSALELNATPSESCSVICHRDLWNNNIMFHYKKIGDNAYEPDDCLLVDFQGVSYETPTADVMFLLYCNLDPKFREINMDTFLNAYYHDLKSILCSHGIDIDNILTKDQFLASANEQRLWGLVACACLIQVFWVDNDLTTRVFSDPVQFEEIFIKDKSSFIKKMMQENQRYKETVMEIFAEIVENYCLIGVDCT